MLEFSLNKVDVEAYRKNLGQLRPDNMLVLLSSQDVETDRLEPIYGTEYRYTEDKAWYEELLKGGIPEIPIPEATLFYRPPRTCSASRLSASSNNPD